MLKGHAKIELTNVETGKTVVHEEDNLFTNLIDELVNNNAFALGPVTGDISGYLPLATRALGGVLLFKEAIAEDPAIMFPPIAPIAYAGDSTDAGTDVRMGTYNKTESKQLSNGYQHIWDFTTSQGNGTIRCIALTHYSVGNGFPGAMYQSLYSESSDAMNARWYSDFVCMNKYAMFFVGWDSSAEHIQIRKLNTIVNNLNSVNARLPDAAMNYEMVEGIVLEKETDKNVVKNGGIVFRQKSNGHCVGYAHYYNGSGDAYIYTCDIDVNTLTYKEGSLTVSDVQLQSFGTGSAKYAAIRDNYLYCYKYNDYTKIYKINLDNVTDISIIEVANPSGSYASIGYDEVTNYIIVGNRQIIFPDDEVFLATREFYSYGAHNTVVRDGVKELIRKQGYSYGMRIVAMNRSYLATINNLASPVVKTAAQTMKITYTITDSIEITLMGISVTTEPNVTRYPAGQRLSLDGMEVMAVYSDASKKALSSGGYSTVPVDNAQLLDTALQNVTIQYTEDDITRYTLQPVTVYALAALDVITQPTKLTYYEGDELSLDGLMMQATYTDDVTEDVTSLCTYTPANGSTLPAELENVAASYTAGQVTKTASIAITVIARVLESIAITTNPKTTYEPGAALDLSGMVVTATYNNGKTADVTASCTANPADGTVLSNEGEQAVVISYTERGVTRTANLTVYVTAGVVLASIAVTNAPTKTAYTEGDALDLTGIAVQAVYTDGTTEMVTGSCVFSPADGDTLNTVGTQLVTVGYTEDGVTKTTSFNVTVAEKPDVEIVPFSTGTDAQIAAMAQALRDGTITVEDTGWAVGDTRSVSLSAKNSDNFGNHAAQTQTLVILNIGGKTLSNGNECSFVVGLKNMLANGTSLEGFGMNASDTNAGGWNACRVRTGCNEDFPDMLPEDLLPAFAEFKNITADGSGVTTIESTDLFSLASEKEIFGSTSYANATAEADNSQFDYYKTGANRIKKCGDSGSSYHWWERSHYSGNSDYFCCVNGSGNADYNFASNPSGLAPFGCF